MSGQAYRISLELEMPESPVNEQLGMLWSKRLAIPLMDRRSVGGPLSECMQLPQIHCCLCCFGC